MDATFYISILRDHAEHLRQLSTDLSEKFAQLERALSEQASLNETDAEPPLTGIAELNDSLFAAADLFHRRLRRFLEDPPQPIRKLAARSL
jgi:hypothetical protein